MIEKFTKGSQKQRDTLNKIIDAQNDIATTSRNREQTTTLTKDRQSWNYSKVHFGIITEVIQSGETTFKGDLFNNKAEQITVGPYHDIDVECNEVIDIKVDNTFAAVRRFNTWWCLAVFPATRAGGGMRIAKCTENPKAQDYIVVNLYDDSGVEQTEGDEAGVNAYALIASGTRLDRCVPRLAEDMLVYVNQINWLNASEEVEARWFLMPPFQASRDYTG